MAEANEIINKQIIKVEVQGEETVRQLKENVEALKKELEGMDKNADNYKNKLSELVEVEIKLQDVLSKHIELSADVKSSYNDITTEIEKLKSAINGLSNNEGGGLQQVKTQVVEIKTAVEEVNEKPINIKPKKDNTLKDLKDEVTTIKLELRDLTVGSSEYNAKLKELVDAESQVTDAMRIRRDGVKSLEGSYNELSDRMSTLKRIYKEINDEAARNEIGKQILELNNELKGLDANVGNFQRNVGNYQGAFEEASKTILKNLGTINPELSTMGRTIMGLIPMIKKTTKVATEGLAGIKKALASTGIGLLVVAFGLLVANIDKVAAAVKRLFPQFRQATEDTNKLTKANNEYIESIKETNDRIQFELDLMAAQGATEQELYEAKIQKIKAERQETEAQIANTKALIANLTARKSIFNQYKKEINELNESLVKLEEELAKHDSEILKTERKHIVDVAAAERKAREDAKKQAEQRAKDLLKENEQAAKERLKQVNDAAKDAKKAAELIIDIPRNPYERLEAEFKKNIDNVRAGADLWKQTITDIENEIASLEEQKSKTKDSAKIAEIEENIKNLKKSLSDIKEDTGNIDTLKKKAEDALEAGYEYERAMLKQEEWLDKTSKKIDEKAQILIATIPEYTEEWYQANADLYTEIYNSLFKLVGESDEMFKARLQEAKNNMDYAVQMASDEAKAFRKAILDDENLQIEAQIQPMIGDILSGNANWNLYMENLKKGVESAKNIFYTMYQEVGESDDDFHQRQLQALAEWNAREQELLNQKLSNFQNYSNSLSSILGSVADLWNTQLQAQVNSGQKSEQEAKKQFEKLKALQYAEATINTIAGAVQAFMANASILPLAVASAAAVTAAGAAQIAKIKATQFGSSSSLSTASSPSVQPVITEFIAQQTESRTGKSEITELANALSNKPMRAYVVESDISAAQSVARQRQEETTF